MKIEDDNQAKEILQKINYYRLSGYGIGLLSSSNKDEYREGISLQHLFRLYNPKISVLILHYPVQFHHYS